MMPDPSWPVVATRDTFTMYEAAPDVVVIWPIDDCVDTEESASESVATQHEHWRSTGRRGAQS